MRIRKGRRFLCMGTLLVLILGTGFWIEDLETKSEKQQASTRDISNDMVIPGGMPIGIYMKTDGVYVLGTEEIEGQDGQFYEPAKNLVKEGDYIVGINGGEVETKSDLISELRDTDAGEVILHLRRNEEEIAVKVQGVQTELGGCMLGIWVRDSVQGLGTVTFLTDDNQFGALGHGIHDADTDDLLEISEGRVYETKILRIQKGVKGTPGGMEGMIIYNQYNLLGSIEQNTECGVFGTVESLGSLSDDLEAVPVASKRSVQTGAAVIRCCVDGSVKEYEIEIERVNYFPLEKNKGMVIRIVDEALIEKTGGIVQGMSGSPVIQNGKLVGAITHVLVNDPTRGYAIFAENMLETARSVAENNQVKDAS